MLSVRKYAFHDKLSEAEKGEEIVFHYLLTLPHVIEVEDVRNYPEYRQKDIDFIVHTIDENTVSSTTTLKRSGVKDEWGDRYKMRGFFEGTVEMSPVISSLPGKPLNSVSNMRKRELLVTTTGSLIMI